MGTVVALVVVALMVPTEADLVVVGVTAVVVCWATEVVLAWLLTWLATLCLACSSRAAHVTYQVLQTTDETVVTGLVTVQGQLVMVRVVA